MEIGRFWAAGPETLSDDLAALGIQVADELRTPSTCPVLPENWDALELFLACQTQWRQAPMGGATGLDYTAVRAVMEMHQVAPGDQRERLCQIRRIEQGALQAMKERRRG
ncbi:DUF1799 domain-containing protein [Chromohalobacter israelensis]|uniref:DUF1799 domain-containing protein n=1 Tax=Chromohalobacter israelensis TaxID=141390 RepID=UPI00265BD84F|nr:DUF1799 domain-containing protein [Chromohalobacter salexigens]MDO0944660.1 DUF1799 domain-containing protein [Chromohalobacter salexigens]